MHFLFRVILSLFSSEMTVYIYKALLSGGCVEERIMQLKGGRRDKNVIRFLLYTYID